jgi:thiamine-monophosphate kinase
MDLSDGLADAVTQLARASGCGARVEADALPVEPAARAWWDRRGQDAVVRAVSGGEDYELLLAVPPRWRGRLKHVMRHVAQPPLTRIGALTRAEPIVLVRDGRESSLPDGFEHFRERTT